MTDAEIGVRQLKPWNRKDRWPPPEVSKRQARINPEFWREQAPADTWVLVTEPPKRINFYCSKPSGL